MDNEKIYRPEAKLDDDLQKELDEALGDMSIGDIVDLEAGKKPRSQSGGDDKIIAGTVVAVQGDDIFVDIGGRSEGLLPADQFPPGELPEEGTAVEVTIEGYDRDGMLRLSRKGAILAAAWDTIERGQVVEGRVTGMNKGGLELSIDGIKAFMPISQIDLARVEELDPYLNQKLKCEISEVDRREGNVVVSRKAVLKREAAANAEQLWQTLHEGKIVSGKVRSIMPYGAFVDIGGVDGLLHIKDMAHSRVEKPEDIVHVGQDVEVRVISIDTESKKIGLGLKQTQADPWDSADAKWSADMTVSGRVVKLMDFGAFVELEPGVEGLVPISECSFRRIGHPKEILGVGDVVKLRVLKVDAEAKRISLSLKQAGDDPWQGATVRYAPDSMIEGVVTRITDFGAFVELAAGVEGLLHISQLSDKRIDSVKSVVSEGQTVTARVLDVDEERRRISLTMKKDTAAGQAVAEGTFADLEAVQNRSDENRKGKKKKPLKGGMEAPGGGMSLGDLKLG
ncbi:MAG: S1 RNA-binding domain-containing protein [Phycisphaerae bacterium]|nr:S1 RNA-binding domain-containing protein [Phycisphaerae bacterium]